MSWVTDFARRHGLSEAASAELSSKVGQPASGVLGSLFEPELTEAQPSDDALQRLALLGRGGIGEVYRAYDPRLGRNVAQKVLRADRLSDPQATERFHREARVLASLQHPGIPAVYGVGLEPDGRPYVTMLEVVGVSLREVALGHHSGQHPRSLRRRVALVQRLAEAAGHAHAAGVLHRDIKPDNVVVGPRDTVHLVDWGLAIRTADARPAKVGTPSWVAPEVLAGRPHSPPSDVYALGRVLHSLLEADALDSEAPVAPGLPDGLDTLLLRALHPDPAQRWPTATALADALTDWLDGAARLERARALVRQSERVEAEAVLAAQASRAEAAAADRALQGVRITDPVEHKREGWTHADAAQEHAHRAKILQDERLQLLEEALTLVPDLPEALAPLAAAHRAAATEAARIGERSVAEAHLAQVRRYDRGEHAAWLRGTARLTLLTDPAGALVTLCRYETRDRQLHPVPERVLGPTPLDVSLPHGAWLLRLEAPGRAPVRYPVLLERLEHWDSGPDPVYLPQEHELGPDDCYVPAGPFVSGADNAGFQSLPTRRSFLPGFVMARHPVTHGDYLAWLGALVDTGRAEEAHRYAPRERGMAGSFYALDPQGRYQLVPDADGDLWDPRWPVFFVDAASAEAYAAWRSEQTGQPWTLPEELQHEKAARGADGRVYPWGHHFDPTFACVRDSHPGRPLPAPIDAYPVDCSVYGVRGLAGNVRAWCQEPYAPPGGEIVHSQRVLRGGCFFFPARGAHGAARMGLDAHRSGDTVGIRLVRRFPPPAKR
jgi:formylglycine-generating enzyme required for sulfatase activity/tRNA A-37 threonylcarbamoyl transferase component Bud32